MKELLRIKLQVKSKMCNGLVVCMLDCRLRGRRFQFKPGQ